ncbi:Hypothetical predicted protein [Marmota monax]|uniref:Uncharacterized protein n=1 Tax=Marmota monax TaxID=9995 RepID=A0A5E4AKJ9_MARMO|nr:Hypothetical predicted protein [Marmota monax]
MSLLGSYRKKTSNDGYESLQLVDSNGDLSAGSGGGGGKQRVNTAAAAARSPARQPPDRASTMDSSGSAAGGVARGAPLFPASRAAQSTSSGLALLPGLGRDWVGGDPIYSVASLVSFRPGS